MTVDEEGRVNKGNAMETWEVETFAAKNKLDVREIEKWHYRLMDEFGDWVLDVYFKRNDNGRVIKNTTMQWKKKEVACLPLC